VAATPFNPILSYLRHLAGTASGPTDGQLLQRYLLDGSEAAFAALVDRHGSMVRGVCRRVLGNCHDADDACQAAFLILLRQAGKIVHRESVGSWLHGVAYRTALKARAAAVRRRRLESKALRVQEADSVPAAVWRELRPILDEEIARLPEKYRLPFVLCYLEGKTNVQTAQQLQWPLGTVATRLAQARARLRQRLTRRGAGLAAGLLVAVGSSAVGKPLWDGKCSPQATLLAKGVLRTMYMTKMRIAAAVMLAAAFLVAAVGTLLHRAAAADTGAGQPPVSVVAPARVTLPAVKKDKVGGTGKEKVGTGKGKLYVISGKVVEIDRDGVEEVLSQLKFMTVDGQAAHMLQGQSFPVLGQEDASIDYVDVGVEVTVVVAGQKDGRLCADIKAQITVPQSQGEKNVLISGQNARCIKLVHPDETIQFEFANGEGTHYRGVFTVHKVP
jgi:RNA polymerase sigma factor (sigma-70 family)